MSIEQDLLAAADALEKTAAEAEKTNNAKKEDPEKTDAKLQKEHDDQESNENNVGVTKAEAKKDDEDREKAEGTSKGDPDSEGSEKKASESDVAEISEELGIPAELAEKVASADPSVVEYIKNLNQVESMGGEDRREKTASELEDDPFAEFLSTPVHNN